MARQRSAPVVRELEERKKTKKKRTAKRAPAQKDDALERVLARVSAEPLAPAEKREPAARRPPIAAAMRTARVVTSAGRAAEILFRGERLPVVAALADEVETEVIVNAARDRSSVLVEVAADAPPVIVGVLQTRIPRNISLKGTTVEIEAEREIILRTGRGALRIREDGDIELVGSRVVAVSRGLFRLVGKMLRLN